MHGVLADSLGFEARSSLTSGGGWLHQTVVTGGPVRSSSVADTTDASAETEGSSDDESSDAQRPSMYPIVGTVTLPDSVEGVPFMWLPPHGESDALRAIMLGREFGRGRVVVIADADLMRNELLRTAGPAVGFIRAVEWIGTARGPIVFDEYHQGYGVHASVVYAVSRALTQTSIGRLTLQGLVAALIVVFAVGARPIPPVGHTVAKRRSPLEHVSALAHAYTQIDAKRLGADRLLRGLRRRHPLGVARTVSHEQYLAVLRNVVGSTAISTELSTDVSLTERVETLDAALRGTAPPHFADVAAAVATIEHTL